MLSWSEIKEMHESGLVTFGAHTVSHPILTRVHIDSAEQEIVLSKRMVEEKLGAPVTVFCYPNGKSSDFNEEIKNVIQKEGFEAAFTTVEKIPLVMDKLSIPRYGLVKEPLYLFGLRMMHFFDAVNQMRRKKSAGVQ